MTQPQVSITRLSRLSYPCQPKVWILKILEILKIKQGLFDFTFIDNEQIIQINKDHLNRDYATDTISFNLGSTSDIVGDIYISLEKVSENAKLLKNTFKNELITVLIHGILHLLEYQDYTNEEKAIMFAEQDRIFALLNLK